MENYLALLLNINQWINFEISLLDYFSSLTLKLKCVEVELM
jgi:hypothetical protein